jgi:hypothetical protein
MSVQICDQPTNPYCVLTQQVYYNQVDLLGKKLVGTNALD